MHQKLFKNYSSFFPSYGYFTFQRSWEEITQKAQKKEEVVTRKQTGNVLLPKSKQIKTAPLVFVTPKFP